VDSSKADAASKKPVEITMGASTAAKCWSNNRQGPPPAQTRQVWRYIIYRYTYHASIVLWHGCLVRELVWYLRNPFYRILPHSVVPQQVSRIKATKINVKTMSTQNLVNVLIIFFPIVSKTSKLLLWFKWIS
jgi:hypothetical protein